MEKEDRFLRHIEQIEERLSRFSINEKEFSKLYHFYFYLKVEGYLYLAYRLAYALYTCNIITDNKGALLGKIESLSDDACYYKNHEIMIKKRLYI